MDGNLSEQAFLDVCNHFGWKDLQAAAKTQAQFYSLSNPYLSKNQKAVVEAVYQMPIGVFLYLFFFLLSSKGLHSWLFSYVIASLVSLPIAILCFYKPRFFNSKGMFLFACLFCSHNYMIILAILAGVYFYKGLVSLGVIALIAATSLLSVFTPSLHLFSFLSKELHPKYLFAKKIWGITLPFESYLQNNNR